MAMSNEEITNEFETLFGDGDTDEDTNNEDPTEDADETEEEEDTSEEDDEASEDEEDSEEDEESSEEEDSKVKPDDKKQAKQNYAFAQQRQQIKAQEKFIKSLGKLIGMENAKPEEIQDKIQEVLLEKQSKEQHIPVEILQRLEKAEAVVAENQAIKRQNEVQSSFADLAEKHELDADAINEFTQYLIENDKNPLEHPEVDIAAEYLKLHYDDMVKAAVDAALGKEKDRQEKVKKKSTSPTPDGKSTPDEGKINTIEDLDKLFSGMDL